MCNSCLGKAFDSILQCTGDRKSSFAYPWSIEGDPPYFMNSDLLDGPCL